MPAPVGLGLTGGPLLVALVLSRVGRIGSLIWYLSPGATLVLREIGICFVSSLAGVKIRHPISGWAPLMIVGIAARKSRKSTTLGFVAF